MTRIDHRERLTALAEARERAQNALAAAEKELRRGVLAADKAKALRRREIARVARISPTIVYKWIAGG